MGTKGEKRYFNVSNAGDFKNAKGDFATGRFECEWPSEFWLSGGTKYIKVIAFVYINGTTKQIDVGTSLHADFNRESPELENFVALSTYGSINEKIFRVTQTDRVFHVWFKDFTGSTVFPALETGYFYLQMELLY